MSYLPATLSRPAVSANASASSQTAASFVVPFATKTLDTNTAFSNTTFTCPIAGTYCISSLFSFTNNDLLTRSFTYSIYVNGSFVGSYDNITLASSASGVLKIPAVLIQLAATNTLTVRVDVVGGASVSFSSAGAQLNIFKVAI